MNTISDETLVSRVIDGEESPGEWDELTARALRDPHLWRTLAETLRDHASFARGVNATVGTAEAIEPPDRVMRTAFPHAKKHSRSALSFGAWWGWAVAALVILTWTVWHPVAVPMNGRVQEARIGASVPAAPPLRTFS